MGLFDRLREPPAEPTVASWRLWDQSAPLTAAGSWRLVEPVARALDATVRLVSVASGTDIDARGRSCSWEFELQMPRRGAHAVYAIRSSGESADASRDPVVLVQRLCPSSGRDLETRPALPTGFRDSPEAVAELADRGVDFVAGPADMRLEGRMTGGARAVWLTFFWDEELTVPFVDAAGFD